MLSRRVLLAATAVVLLCCVSSNKIDFDGLPQDANIPKPPEVGETFGEKPFVYPPENAEVHDDDDDDEDDEDDDDEDDEDDEDDDDPKLDRTEVDETKLDLGGQEGQYRGVQPEDINPDDFPTTWDPNTGLNWDTLAEVEYLNAVDSRSFMQKVLKNDSVALMVGAGDGEIVKTILEIAHQGRVIAYEPAPDLHAKLEEVYPRGESPVQAMPVALSEVANSGVEFHIVDGKPKYNSLVPRAFAPPNETSTKIQVDISTIDIEVATYVPAHQTVALINIDVGGGDAAVILGAKRTLKKHRPNLVFEFRRGHTDPFGISPGHLLDFLDQLDYDMSLCMIAASSKHPLEPQQFEMMHMNGRNFKMCAWPRPQGPKAPRKDKARQLKEIPDNTPEPKLEF